jgi:two-component system sensor histidine kinase HydH
MAAVGKLAAGVAHEVRNPLSSIKGFATYFRERYRSVPEDQHITSIMIQEVDRINRVVGQLLEFAKPILISKKKVAVKKLIEDSLSLIETQISEKDILLETECPAHIEDILVDPDQIGQVLLNLYLNAAEAMQSGGRLSVSAAALPEKHAVTIKISDTGAGIREENIAQIFDPYFTTKPSGTGLGLAISQNIIEAHNGEILIDSRPGAGTTVTLILPRLPSGSSVGTGL